MVEKANPQQEFSDIDELKKLILFKIDFLKRRGALCSDLNKKFSSVGFESFNSFKTLGIRIKKLDTGDVLSQLIKAHNIVDSELIKHIKFHNKRAYFYKVSKHQLEDIYQKLNQPNDLFLLGENSNSFSYEDASDLLETSFSATSEDFKLIYLKTSRHRKENIRIPKEIHKIDVKNNEDIIDLIKVVQYSMNAYDFIAFDFKNEYLVIGADLNGVFPRQETEKAVDKIRISIRKLAKLVDLQANNLRNCVKNLEDESIGDILDHAFITADGGYNHAGKSLTKGQDIRKDNFHADGIKGKEADYYGVMKTYTLENDEKPILKIRMTFRDYKKTNVPIRYAIIDGVKTFDGLKFSIRKVIEHNHN